MATLYSSGASTPDATETTAGKLRISTDAERIAGTNDTTAMTPLKVAEAIAASSGAVTGALVYRGSYDASTASPDITGASKGDFYLVSVAGALDGVALSVGDHLVFNQDASDPVTSTMFDKIDSTDAVSSVNGQTGVVSLTASDVNALASGDNISELTNDSGYLTSAPVTSVNTLTGAVSLTAADVGALATGDNVSALVNDSGYLTSAPVSSVNTQTGAVSLTAADVGALATGDNVSALVNDSGYLTSAPVSSVNTQTGAVSLTAADVGALATGDNVSALTNDAGYITSAPVSSVNSLTGAVTLSANDLAADHTASNYTPTNANIDGHLGGLDAALASLGGSTNPNIYVSTSTTYAPSTSDAPNLLVWYGGSNTSTFTLTLPDILSILTGTGAVNTVVESFTMWVGRGYDGDITLSSTNGIDGLGGTISYASTLTVSAGTWVKIVGWKTSSNNARYLVEVPESAPVSSVNSLTGAVALSADDLAADHTASNYTPANTNIDGHLSGIDTALASAGGLAYTAITADPAPALANKHYSCTGTFTITLDTSGYNAGEQIRIKNMGTGTITIDPQTGTIDGSSTDYTLDVQFSAITLVSTGTNWEIV